MEEERGLTGEAQLLADLVGGLLHAGSLALHLKTDLDDLERVGKDHLRSTGSGAGKDLKRQVHLAGLARNVAEPRAQVVVDDKLDGLFGSNADQLRTQTLVEAPEALVLEHLFTRTRNLVTKGRHSRAG